MPGGPGAGEGETGSAGSSACEAKSGINRVWWDLRSEPSTEIRLRTSPLYAPEVIVGPEGWRPAPSVGRISLLAPPGTYTVTLKVGEEKSSQKLNVFKDPHSTEDASKAIRKDAEDLADKLTGVEGKLLQLKATGRGQDDVRFAPMLLQKISYLAAEVGGSSDFAPTTQQVAVQEELKQQGDKYQQEFEQLVTKDVAAFNVMLRERNIPNIIVKTP